MYTHFKISKFHALSPNSRVPEILLKTNPPFISNGIIRIYSRGFPDVAYLVTEVVEVRFR